MYAIKINLVVIESVKNLNKAMKGMMRGWYGINIYPSH